MPVVGMSRQAKVVIRLLKFCHINRPGSVRPPVAWAGQCKSALRRCTIVSDQYNLGDIRTEGKKNRVGETKNTLAKAGPSHKIGVYCFFGHGQWGRRGSGVMRGPVFRIMAGRVIAIG